MVGGQSWATLYYSRPPQQQLIDYIVKCFSQTSSTETNIGVCVSQAIKHPNEAVRHFVSIIGRLISSQVTLMSDSSSADIFP